MLRNNYLTLAEQWGLFPEQVRAVEIMDAYPTRTIPVGNLMAITTFETGPIAMLTPEEWEVVKRFWPVACVRAA